MNYKDINEMSFSGEIKLSKHNLIILNKMYQNIRLIIVLSQTITLLKSIPI
jgi:hypothetical protein